MKKLKIIKKEIIKSLCQTYANILAKKLESEISKSELFSITLEQAAKLNAYCIVFHEIYLD